MYRALKSLLAAGTAAAALAACAPTVETRGNLPTAERLEQIRAGEITRDDVAAILGTPSTTGTLGDETWYYIGTRTETTAFFQPEVKERLVLAIHFDEKGVVKDVRQLSAEDGKAVKPVDRETPTAGNEMTVLQQLIGNIGRFGGNKDQAQ